MRELETVTIGDSAGGDALCSSTKQDFPLGRRSRETLLTCNLNLARPSHFDNEPT